MYNYVNLIGTVKDIKEQFIVNQKVVHITLACQRPFREPDGKFMVDEFDVSVYEYLAEVAQENLKKGSKISVKGRLLPSNYKTLCKIVAERIIFMDNEKENKED